MKKRLLLCAVLAALLCRSAYAWGNGGTTEVYAECNLPEIEVTVPASADIFFNPYEMPVEINGTSVTDQIVCAPAVIENKSMVPIEVSTTVVGWVRPESDMELYWESTRGTNFREKLAFIYFEMKTARTANANGVTWAGAYDEEKHIVVQPYTETKENIVTLAQADKPDHFGVFRLSGDCVRSPESGWTEYDGIDAQIAFTFTPLPRDNS